MINKKVLRIMSNTAIATALASAVLIPTAAVQAEATQNISNILVESDGQIYSITKEDYDLAQALGTFNPATTPIKYLVVDGFTYDKEEYDVFVALDGKDLALDKLVSEGEKVTVPSVEGEIVDGVIVPTTPVTEDFEVTDIAAINGTSVTVNFPSNSEITEADLVGKTITLKSGETTLTATYKAESLADDSALFELPEGSSLVDATTYTVNGQGFTFAEDSFQAKFGPIVPVYSVETSAVTEGESGSLYITAKDQYGNVIEVPADVKLSGTLNDLPLTTKGSAPELSYNASTKAIVVDTTLNVGDELVVNAGASTFEFTVVEAAPSVLEKFEIKADKTTIKSGETVNLNVVARDQFNNPVVPAEGEVRWTVNGDIEVAKGDAQYAFNKENAGTYEVKAYYIVNGKVNATATITVTVEKVALDTAIANAEQVTDTGYTEASWTSFEDALAAAKAIAAKSDANQLDIDAAVTALTNAQNALEDAIPEITAATINVEEDTIDFTNVAGATATLDLTGLASEATATVATVTVSEAATLTLTYKNVTKNVVLVKGENELDATDLIPGLKQSTPLTVGFLQTLDGAGTLEVVTVLKDATENEVEGTLTLNYDAK